MTANVDTKNSLTNGTFGGIFGTMRRHFGFKLEKKKKPREWTVAQTVAAITRTDPSIDPEDIKAIRDHKIDGKALLELSFDELVKYGKVMLGPASKIKRLAEMWRNKSDEFMQEAH